MRSIKIKKVVIFAGLFFLQPVLNPGSFAFAKRRHPPKAYSFITEGGKASQGECDGEGKISRRLKRLKEYAKAGFYMGSELQTPEINGKTNDEMWKHLFKAKDPCNTALAKTPSSVDSKLTNKKMELPPDDPADSDDEGPDLE